MNAGFGSWLLGMSLGASALGGMLGMAGGIFIVLAATTFGSALLYAISGFGFAVLAAPLFLLFLDPARAIQLVIIISTVLSIVVLRGLLPAIAPWLYRPAWTGSPVMAGLVCDIGIGLHPKSILGTPRSSRPSTARSTISRRSWMAMSILWRPGRDVRSATRQYRGRAALCRMG